MFAVASLQSVHATFIQTGDISAIYFFTLALGWRTGSLLAPLRRKNNIILDDMGTCENACVFGVLYDINGYPGLVLNGSRKITGELYSLPENFSFEKIDFYEGFYPDKTHKSEFIRVKTEIFNIVQGYPANAICRAWVYLYNQKPDGLEEIHSGDYMNFIYSRGKY